MDLFQLRMRIRPSSISNDEYVKHLNDIGVKCGQHTKFFDITKTTIDTGRPWLLEIGDYCKITGGVTILTHDYSRSVLRRVYGDVVAEAGRTIIGDNVFIGMNSIILMGTQIGDNVIIGAGSVVRGKIPPNSVITGNPAKVVCSLEEHYNNRKRKYVTEAFDSAIAYRKKYGSWPSIEKMAHFFPLYLERSEEALEANHINTNMSGDDEQEIIKDWLKTEPLFENYDDFLRECEERMQL